MARLAIDDQLTSGSRDIATPVPTVLADQRQHVAFDEFTVGLAGERQQAGDRRLEPVELTEALLQHDRRVGPRSLDLGLDRHSHGGDWRAQLMRYLRRERAFACEQFIDPDSVVDERRAE